MHFFGILVGFDYFLDDFGGALGRGYGGHELNSKRLLLSFLLISLLLLFWVVVKADFNQTPS